MLYEKPSEKFSAINFGIAIFIFITFLLIIGIHASPSLWSAMPSWTAFEDSKATDWINAMGQLATAGAFIFALLTFFSSKKGERQRLLLDESKLTIQRMEDVLAKIDITKTNMRNIQFVCSCLSNLATDLEAIYSDITDEANKAIVRMHWQNMHFNHLQVAFKGMNLHHFLTDIGVKPRAAFIAIQRSSRNLPQIDGAYELYRRVLLTAEVSPFMHIRHSEIQDLGQFITSFFDKNKTDDYMFGTMSWLTCESGAPLIAALFLSSQEQNNNTARLIDRKH